MSVSIGIALSFVAMLCWGFGDFWIQKSARKIGDLEALFFITLFGAFILAPFAYKNLPAVFYSSWHTIAILAFFCVTLFFAAILDFEALRVGKLAVVEPIWSFEVPVSAAMAFFILGEEINLFQILLIVALLFGLAMVSLKKGFHLKKFLLERGTLLALLGAVVMGAANFFMGWGSRVTDPVMANFLSDIFIALLTGTVLVGSGRLGQTFRDGGRNAKVLLQMSVADKVAWLAFAFSMSVAPIAVATALSESYIIVAVLLGIFINKEKLARHQKLGLVLAIVSALVLAAVTV